MSTGQFHKARRERDKHLAKIYRPPWCSFIHRLLIENVFHNQTNKSKTCEGNFIVLSHVLIRNNFETRYDMKNDFIFIFIFIL